MIILIIMIVSQIGLLSSLEQLHGELHLHCLASRGTMVPVMVIVGGVQVMIMKTRSSWLNCALRDDETVYWVSIGHYEAVAVGN